MKAAERIAAVWGIEFRVSLRNRWVLLSTVILTMFALALTFTGAGGGQLKAGVLTVAAASLATLSVYLIPLIALLISYDSFAGEVERGTMALVLATPLNRSELVLGKFIGLVSVLAIAVATGFAIAAIAATAIYGVDWSGLAALARLIGTGILLGAVFIAIGMTASIASARASMAAALSIGIWLVAVVLYDLALLAGIVVDNGGVFTKTVFPFLVVTNPGDAFRIFNLAAAETSVPMGGFDGLANTLPFSPAYALVALFVWLFVLLGAAFLKVRRLTP